MDGMIVAPAAHPPKTVADSARHQEFPITGMSCVACAARVRRALEKLPHHQGIAVSATSDKATIFLADGDPEPDLAQIQKLLRDAGYGLDLVQHRLVLSAIPSQTEADRAGRLVAKLPGCYAAEINAATGILKAQFLRSATTRQILETRLRQAGFHPLAETAEKPPSWAPSPVLIACLLTAPLLLPMVLALFGITLMLPTGVVLLLGAVVQFFLGRRFYQSALRALRHGSGTMDQLIVLGTSAAWALTGWNIATTPAPEQPALYIEPAAAIITFVLVGQYLEQRAKQNANAALSALAALMPPLSRVLRDGEAVMIPTETLAPDDIILVRPGERIGADGRIVEGTAALDEQVVTGESAPVTRKPGDLVAAGSLDLDGPLGIAVTAIGPASSLGRIITAVEQGQATKAKIQRLADRLCAIFVPTILVIALLTLFGGLGAGLPIDVALVRAVCVLVIACPCALGLATPAALFVAVGRAATHGILIKRAETLETARTITLVCFDKTGTLTEGRPHLVALETVPDGADENLLWLAACLQADHDHPISRAIKQALIDSEHPTPVRPPQSSRTLPGLGIDATFDGQPYLMGSEKLLTQCGLDPAAGLAAFDTHPETGYSRTFLIRGPTENHPAKILALFTFEDPIRTNVVTTIQAMQARGITVALLTGDTAGSAERLATACGITLFGARLSPTDKALRIRSWQAEGHHVAMVGDGINDAPALAAANLAIAVSSGTDVAIAAADATILGGDPTKVLRLLVLAERTRWVMGENLAWAFLFNGMGIPAAAFGLLDPMLAAAAMAGSSVAVISNALRLYRV